MRTKGFVWGLLLLSGCASGAERPAVPRASAKAPSSAPTSSATARSVAPHRGADAVPEVSARFAAYLEKYRDLTPEGLDRELSLGPPANAALTFDPSKAKYFDEVVSRLKLTPDEIQRLRTRGVVSVDHAKDYSMAAAYFAIYTRDLPVLVTTDSILQALHRSYDEILLGLETSLFSDTIGRALAAAHDALGAVVARPASADTEKSIHDVDVYLTVALNLLNGAGGPPNAPGTPDYVKEAEPTTLALHTKTGSDAEVRALLQQISELRPQSTLDSTAIYGGRRPIDCSQFAPRGHYTLSLGLKRYFRTMMWLGRADTGFFLTEPSKDSGTIVDTRRERRDAALLTTLFVEGKALGPLTAMSDIVDFLVGSADGLTPNAVAAALADQGMDPSRDWDDAKIDALFASLAGNGAQQIRSQVLRPPPGGDQKTTPPSLFQLFGQRYVVDSFVLSRVVFDSIVFRGEQPARFMPSGLDVMAALGNDEAVRLLRPELERYGYSANLLAARRLVEDTTPEGWRVSLYQGWLSGLRALNEPPAAPAQVPEVMHTEAWRRKELQTQLASWAELRHDTLLYAKQSYGPETLCEYPEGYVEPYPDFYDRLAALAHEAERRMTAADVSGADPAKKKQMEGQRAQYVQYFQHFGSVMAWLKKIAEKELAATPLSAEDTAFLKKTVDIRGMGSGPPRYDGWYPSLLFAQKPADYKPTIADVHTYPGTLQPPAVLEEATGSATFLVVAVDSEKDCAIYVGPASTYYEFTVPPADRLTDEKWAALVRQTKRPVWIDRVQGPAVARDIGDAPGHEADPEAVARQLKARELYDEVRRLEQQRDRADTKTREHLAGEIERVRRRLRELTGTCNCPPGDTACPCR